MKYLKISDSREEIVGLVFNSQIYSPSIFFNSEEGAGVSIIYNPHLETIDEIEITITETTIEYTSGNPIDEMASYITTALNEECYVLYKKKSSTSNHIIASKTYRRISNGGETTYKDINNGSLFKFSGWEENIQGSGYSKKVSTTLGTGTFVFKKLRLNF